MRGSNKQSEIPNNLQSPYKSKSQASNWLSLTVSAIAEEFNLKYSITQKVKIKNILAQMDEVRLRRIGSPLSLSQPTEVYNRLEQAGGLQSITSIKAQQAIASWELKHKSVQTLQELSETSNILLATHEQRQLRHHEAVLRSLIVLAMIPFVPGNDDLRRDLAVILEGSPEEIPGLIKNFRIAALSNSQTVSIVDQRILDDPTWSIWAKLIIDEGKELSGLCKTSTDQAATGPIVSQTYSLEEYESNSLDEALLTEFFTIIATIASRLTKRSGSPKNKVKIQKG